jgi:light-regulated signal transduction histidine kinase (bacteriophytochrome)
MQSPAGNEEVVWAPRDHCEAEAIHHVASIQPHGVMLCVDARHGTVLAASGNRGMIPRLAGTLEGRALCDVWPALVQCGDDAIEELDDGYAVSRHTRGATTFIEIEPLCGEDRIPALRLDDPGAVLERLNKADTLEALCEVAANAIRRISGMERVLIYRFEEGGHGEVIAESKVDDWMESFAGFHFPSADIPAQARALYLVSPCRFVPRRDYEPVDLIPPLDPRNGAPFDLSRSRLRSLSPIHRLYQRNLGVDGAMSISIVNEGRLWGLVVGHHRKPHRVSIPARQQVMTITSGLAMRLSATETAEERDARVRHVVLHAKLLEQIAGADDFVSPLIHGDVKLTDLFFASSGAAVIYRDDTGEEQDMDVRTVGQAPDRAHILAFSKACRDHLVDGVFATDHASSILPAFSSHAGYASGVLAITLGDEGRHMILWFRPETIRTTIWGGATPDQVAREKQAGNYLPRQSFARWVEERRGHSRPWPRWKIDIARSLRTALNDVILRQMRTIRRLNTRLQESDRAKSRFLAHMSHELRTPLNAVLGFSQMLEAGIYGAITDKQKEVLALIGEAGTHLLVMVNDVLDLSKVEAGKMELHSAPCDLVALSERVVTLQIGFARSQGLMIKSCHAPDLPRISADERLVKQMLLNLLSNSLKFTPAGGSVTIATILRPDGGVSLSVADTGIGIPGAQHISVLEPFRQAHDDMMVSHAGTGLGLPIVKSLIELHGGFLNLDSQVGRGTTIRLNFPRSATLLP